MVGRDTRLSWTQEAYRGLYGYRQDLECGALTVRSHYVSSLTPLCLCITWTNRILWTFLRESLCVHFPLSAVYTFFNSVKSSLSEGVAQMSSCDRVVGRFLPCAQTRSQRLSISQPLTTVGLADCWRGSYARGLCSRSLLLFENGESAGMF